MRYFLYPKLILNTVVSFFFVYFLLSFFFLFVSCFFFHHTNVLSDHTSAIIRAEVQPAFPWWDSTPTAVGGMGG